MLGELAKIIPIFDTAMHWKQKSPGLGDDEDIAMAVSQQQQQHDDEIELRELDRPCTFRMKGFIPSGTALNHQQHEPIYGLIENPNKHANEGGDISYNRMTYSDYTTSSPSISIDEAIGEYHPPCTNHEMN